MVIINLKNAWKYALNNLSIPFSLEFACAINNEVVHGERLSCGKLRDGGVFISGTSYLPPLPTEEGASKENKRIWEQSTSATEKALDFLLYGYWSQLFFDGNKRTSYIYANKILIENGAGLFIIKDKNFAEFSEKLSAYYETGDGLSLKQFFYQECLVGINSATASYRTILRKIKIS